MGGCVGDGDRKFYMVTAAGVAKITSIIIGSAPVILAFILYDFYNKNPRPNSMKHIRIDKTVRETWELAYLIVATAALGITLLNLLIYTCFKSLSTNVWTKRFDCTYFTVEGTALTVVGFIMVASAQTSTPENEPIEVKYAAGFLGIVTGIVYWGAATLVNHDD